MQIKLFLFLLLLLFPVLKFYSLLPRNLSSFPLFVLSFTSVFLPERNVRNEGKRMKCMNVVDPSDYEHKTFTMRYFSPSFSLHLLLHLCYFSPSSLPLENLCMHKRRTTFCICTVKEKEKQLQMSWSLFDTTGCYYSMSNLGGRQMNESDGERKRNRGKSENWIELEVSMKWILYSQLLPLSLM